MPLFFIALFETFSRGIFTTKGIAIHEVAQIIMLNMEKPKAAESRVNNVPLQNSVRKKDTAIEAIRHKGEAFLQKSSVMSEE